MTVKRDMPAEEKVEKKIALTSSHAGVYVRLRCVHHGKTNEVQQHDYDNFFHA